MAFDATKRLIRANFKNLPVLCQDDEETRRCRRVRDALNRCFRTVDALCDYLEQGSRAGTKHAVRSAKAQAQKSSRPAQGKPVHKG